MDRVLPLPGIGGVRLAKPKHWEVTSFLKTVKACILETPSPVENRPFKYTDVRLPIPESNQLLIRVTACGICRTDIHVTEGDLQQHLSPVIPGHQIVGVVETFGDAVSGFSSGQRVGVAWLHSTCGNCRFCLSGRENLCENGRVYWLDTQWRVRGIS